METENYGFGVSKDTTAIPESNKANGTDYIPALIASKESNDIDGTEEVSSAEMSRGLIEFDTWAADATVEMETLKAQVRVLDMWAADAQQDLETIRTVVFALFVASLAWYLRI